MIWLRYAQVIFRTIPSENGQVDQAGLKKHVLGEALPSSHSCQALATRDLSPAEKTMFGLSLWNLWMKLPEDFRLGFIFGHHTR